jgi:chromosome segregation protein
MATVTCNWMTLKTPSTVDLTWWLTQRQTRAALASMSGGEKSLTALSFIFALQRYRPSPFYAFDEVDMFLDGANVERLARMIKQQATLAQFIVVSLRRPMIESSERTIGVTQARGAYTQVLGLKLPPKSVIR